MSGAAAEQAGRTPRRRRPAERDDKDNDYDYQDYQDYEHASQNSRRAAGMEQSDQAASMDGHSDSMRSLDRGTGNGGAAARDAAEDFRGRASGMLPTKKKSWF